MTTGISWTQETWNPTTGCSHVSPGCEHCYAESLSLRYGWSKKPWTAANAAENVVLHPERMGKPRSWRKPRLVFVDSMSDLFHEQVPDHFIRQVFCEMADCQRHTFQILTKRPERMRAFVSEFVPWWNYADTTVRAPLPNVWLGVSVEDQRRADERIPVLLQTPAAVRFISAEPLLGAVDLSPWLNPPVHLHGNPKTSEDAEAIATLVKAAVRHFGLSWVIAGGESGLGHRPFDASWARSLRDQCQSAGVAFFYKQGSGARPGMNRELDGRTWDEMPVAAS